VSSLSNITAAGVDSRTAQASSNWLASAAAIRG
jgi:hypothetical protein